MKDYPILEGASDTRHMGATLDKERDGTNFVFYAGKDATNIELCLFDRAEGAHETEHYNLAGKEPVYGNDGTTLIGYLWHGFAPGIGEGQLYGFRVDGPPERGFNPNKLLIDPAAKAITHDLVGWDPSMAKDNQENDGHIMPKARVVDWQALHAEAAEIPPGIIRDPEHPENNLVHANTIIYETHVKGFTKLHPVVPDEDRGTYRGLAHDAIIDWVKSQGITSLELQPIESHGEDYWGYSPVANMAPHVHYAATTHPEQEFMEMVKKLKKNGIEVIMDVVPNHTKEGHPQAPAANLSLEDPHLYSPDGGISGCGNTRDFGHPINRRLFLEELKYWRRMGVAGFRIDLASVLGRDGDHGFDIRRSMLDMIRKDPELADVKFYGEPWDCRGHFAGQLAYIDNPADNHIAEWDDEARERINKAAYDRHEDITREHLIQTLSGTHHRFPFPGAGAVMGVNYNGSHDGATAYDMVSSPDGKKNEPNGEHNRDGNDIPRYYYWNSDEDRDRVLRFGAIIRNLSIGGLLETAGAERWHTQMSNTNPYAQDNEITWLKWGSEIPEKGRKFMDYTGALNQFRLRHPALRRTSFFKGQVDAQCDFSMNGQPLKDVTWLDEHGNELVNSNYHVPGGLQMLLSGDPDNNAGEEKSFVRRVQGREHEEPLLVLINPTRQDNMEFTLPEVPGLKWKPAFNSMGYHKDTLMCSGNDKINLSWRSVQIFEGVRERVQAMQKYDGDRNGDRQIHPYTV